MAYSVTRAHYFAQYTVHNKLILNKITFFSPYFGSFTARHRIFIATVWPYEYYVEKKEFDTSKKFKVKPV